MVRTAQSKYNKYKLKYLQLSQNTSQTGGALGSSFSFGCYNFCYKYSSYDGIDSLFLWYLKSTVVNSKYTYKEKNQEIINFHPDKKESIDKLLMSQGHHNLMSYLTLPILNMMFRVFKEFNDDKPIQLGDALENTPPVPPHPPTHYYTNIADGKETVAHEYQIKNFNKVFANDLKYIPVDGDGVNRKTPYLYTDGDINDKESIVFNLIPLFIHKDPDTCRFIEIYLMLKSDKEVGFLQQIRDLNLLQYMFSNVIKITGDDEPELVEPQDAREYQIKALNEASKHYFNVRTNYNNQLNTIHNHKTFFIAKSDSALVIFVPCSKNMVYVIECRGLPYKYTFITLK